MEKKTGSLSRNQALAQPGGKKKKTSGAAVATLIVVLLLVGMIAGAVVCYLQDYFGLRTTVVGFFIDQDQQYDQRMQAIEQRQLALDEREAALEQTAAEQARTDERQQRQQQELDAREAALEQEDRSLSSRTTAFDRRVAEFDEVVERIAAMDPKNAAAVLESMPAIQDAARVLTKMPVKKASAILDEMTTEGALNMTNQMIALSQ